MVSFERIAPGLVKAFDLAVPIDADPARTSKRKPAGVAPGRFCRFDPEVDQYLSEQQSNNDPAAREINLAQILVAVPDSASAVQLEAFGHYGRCIGLAFQIADDVLDVTATSDELGKTAGKDLAFQKSTYPALLGIEGAIARADALVHEGCAALAAAGVLTPALEATARFIVTRRS